MYIIYRSTKRRWVSAFANIFMGKLQKDLLDQVTYKPAVRRYILKEIKLLLPTIEGTTEWSQESVTFMDTRVIHEETNRLVLDLQFGDRAELPRITHNDAWIDPSSYTHHTINTIPK